MYQYRGIEAPQVGPHEPVSLLRSLERKAAAGAAVDHVVGKSPGQSDRHESGRQL